MSEPLTEAAIRARAHALVAELGPKRAAKALGVSRDTALSLAAGAPVTPGTLALARERLAERDAAFFGVGRPAGVEPLRGARMVTRETDPECRANMTVDKPLLALVSSQRAQRVAEDVEARRSVMGVDCCDGGLSAAIRERHADDALLAEINTRLNRPLIDKDLEPNVSDVAEPPEGDW